jgi:hypothetical protein
MINIKQGILLASIAITSVSCSPKIPFTQSLRDQYKLSPEELKHIQFYLSDPVVLRRGTTSESQKSTEDGTLIVKSGKDLEQVVFKANTAGAIEEVVDDKKFTVAFEEGNEKFLVFGSNSDRNGYYRLQALQWQNNGKGKINYGGQTYFSNSGSDQSYLLFKMKSLRNLKIQEKVVKGKKVN